MTPTYARTRLPVTGGELTIGTWGDSPTPLIALHGVTSTHMDWLTVGEQLGPELGVVAPDLRGRGGSAGISGPWGMAAHADDVVAVLDHAGLDRGILVGHSMGGFVAVMAAIRHPDRVAGLVLVDGGLPAVEANEGGDTLTRVVLEAARARLEVVYPTPDDYVESVRTTLPEGGEPDDAFERIARYDLTPAPGGWHVAGTYDAIEADARHIAGEAAAEALASLTHDAILLRAPRGLPPRADGLYSAAEVSGWTTRVGSLVARDVPDTDHGTIIRAPQGISAIREAALALGVRARGPQERGRFSAG